MAHAMMLFVLGLLPGTAESLSFVATEWAEPRHTEALATHKPLGNFERALDRVADRLILEFTANGETGP
jgi:hypothetical protein